MKRFTDNAGRTWTVEVNVGAIKRCKSLLGVNLLETVEGRLLEQLITDPILLVDLLYVICQDQANRDNVSDEQFGQAMAGDAIDAATTALLEELVDFFPQAKRGVLRRALEKLKTFEAKAIELATRRLDDPRLDQQINAALEAIENEPLEVKTPSTPGG